MQSQTLKTEVFVTVTMVLEKLKKRMQVLHLSVHLITRVNMETKFTEI